jgi:hypothetical protein
MAALGPIEILFFLAPLLVVPLAIPMLGPGSATSLARRIVWPGALAAIASFLVPRGLLAAGLASLWLIVLIVLALHGLGLLREPRSSPRVALAAACLLVPVGGVWLVISRLGRGFLGFEEPIPLLTAVHFHYAAFATLTLIGRAGAALRGRVHAAIVGAVIVGTLLVVVGISFLPVFELLGALAIAGGLSTFAWLTLVEVVPRAGWRSGALLAVSAASILAGMACAVAWAVGRVTDWSFISLGEMARVHGPLNALGFCLCGLLGWTLAPRNLSAATLYRKTGGRE